MNTNSNPSTVEGVIVISSNEHSPELIIQKILQVEHVPCPIVTQDPIKGYEWKVDTKYYSAKVNLYSVMEKIELDSEFSEKIRATVFSFNGNEPSSFEDVLSWMPFLENVSAEVQLLICDCCNSDEVYRKKVLRWCVANGFELIELNPSEETEDDDSGIFSKSKGYGRVIEALQSHMWSNLVMKGERKLCLSDGPGVYSRYLSRRAASSSTSPDVIRQAPSFPERVQENTWERNKLEKKENDASGCSVSSVSTEKSDEKSTVDNEELTLEDEQWLQKVFDEEDQNGEAFEALFAKFASMKEKASNLSGEERKKYAEKVAVAFWKAMGGDEEEIEGLDDDE